MGMDMGMMSGSTGGLIDGLRETLSFLPEWAATVVIALIVIVGAMLVGWIAGKIIGSILYPDPDKQSVLSKKQKFIVLGGAVAAVALTLFALTYTPKPAVDDTLPVSGGMTDGMDEFPTDGEIPEDDGMTDEETDPEADSGEEELSEEDEVPAEAEVVPVG